MWLLTKSVHTQEHVEVGCGCHPAYHEVGTHAPEYVLPVQRTAS